MPVLSWDEIRSRALHFQNEWAEETSENAESKTFWNDFFDVFGVSRRRVATFEERVKIDSHTKFIDLLWKGRLLIEHKSKGKDLDKAYTQATDYFEGIHDRDLPQYVLVSDFEQFRLYDLDDGQVHQFKLAELYQNVQLFSFIAGYEKHNIAPQDPVNNKAAEMMGKIHDSLQAIHYTGSDLDTLLVRLVFCLFADDTGIFNKGLFRDFLEDNTNEDGTDLAPKLQYLFEILDTPIDKRFVDDSIYNEFPYVNGSLFTKRLRTAVFNEEMRNMLLECSNLDWGKISPAIFGSMFQSAMDNDKRRNLGAHYTSEENIMKVIRPLFLDNLLEEFKRIKDLKRNKIRLLDDFQQKLAGSNFFDPACGSGNFLIVAYREIRKLELAVLKEKNYEQYGYEAFQLDISLDFNDIIKCNVDQFYGIEIDSFSAQIAQVALWIIDHQMNIEASLYFGASFARLPLSEHANIVNGNSLALNWNDILDARDCDYILGNPPFVGARIMNDAQKRDVQNVFGSLKGKGNLDYVTCWFLKACRYIQGSSTEVSFVSTNSICQGEQVPILWDLLINELGVFINFAYTTFEWNNDARGVAHVYCVVIGFSLTERKDKYIFNNTDKIAAKTISPYLIDAPFVVIKGRSKPVSPVKRAVFGSMANDDEGALQLRTQEEKETFEKNNPSLVKYIRPFVGGEELINQLDRWCLWLVDAAVSDLRQSRNMQERAERVRAKRASSTRPGTVRAAETPYLFGEIRQPAKGGYILIPRTSSQNRKYIPMGFLDSSVIASDSAIIIPGGDLWLFGVIESRMHMVWVETVAGRLKADFRYSARNVYNTFPFPSETNREEVEAAAKKVLAVRELHAADKLADLYNPLYMPLDLMKAHQKLDKAVEKAYRKKNFNNDTERLTYLFELYEVLTLSK